MIDAVLKLILAVFVLSMIIFPVYVNLFKERLWEYVKQKLEEQEKHDKLVRDMKQRKKGNQGKKYYKIGRLYYDFGVRYGYQKNRIWSA